MGAMVVVTCKSSEDTSSAERRPEQQQSEQGQPKPSDGKTAITPTSRILGCNAELNAGKTLTVTIENLQTRDIQTWVAWAYLYKEGDHVGRVRIEYSKLLGAEKSITRTASFQDESPDHVECDVSEVLFADGETWRNDNVVFATADSRPLGGISIIPTSPASIVWTGSISDPSPNAGTKPSPNSGTKPSPNSGTKPGTFTLRNDTGRELKVQRAGVFYLDDSGKTLSKSVANVQQILAPSESVQLSLGVRESRIPAGTTSIRGVVSEAIFMDGDHEIWRDRNLERAQ